MIFLAGSRRVPGPLLLLLFDSSSSQSIQSSSGSKISSNPIELSLSPFLVSSPLSSSDSSEALVDDFLAASFAACLRGNTARPFLDKCLGADTLIDRNMTNQLRIRRKSRYLRDMAAVLLNIGRNLIIFLIKQELMSSFTLYSSVCGITQSPIFPTSCSPLAAGNPAVSPIWNFAILRASGIKSVIINIGCKLRHDRLNQTVECRPVCIFALSKAF